jgi:predicted O-methyltransferase YrrM
MYRLMNQFQDLDNPYLTNIFNDILAANFLAPLSTSYLPWSGSSMRPSGLVNVLNDIFINNRAIILECGGGISTFYIARLLSSRGGHLYTVEHNQEWLDLLQNQLNKEGLAHLVTFIYAPLKPTNLSLENIPWYDGEAIDKQLPQDKKIDLLLVDGPPAYEEHLKYSRYPAVPYFLSQLKSDFTIVIDDANRSGEQEIIKRWEKILNLDFEMREGDIAIARTNH